MRITVVDWKTDFRLSENFLEDKVKGMVYPAKVIGVDINALGSDEEKAEAMARFVLDNARDFVWRLSEYEMEIVRELANAGHGKAARFRQADCIIPMCLVHVANVLTTPEEERTTVWMADELLDAVTPFVRELDNNEEYKHEKELERYVIGLTCLYGPLLKGEVKRLLEDFYEDDEVEEAFRVMGKNMIYTIGVTDVMISGKRDTMYYPPYINLIDDEVMRCYHERVRRGVKQDFKEYDYDQILAAGDMTAIRIPNSGREKLIRALCKYAGKTRLKAEGEVFLIWKSAEEGMDPRDIVDNVLSWCETKKEAKLLQKVLVQYLNNIPMWCLNGYTSLELLAIDHTKVGVTSRFGDARDEPEIEGAELFGDVTIEKLDDYNGFCPFPMGEA